jgi:alpha-L-arabinofuranosidase
MSAEVFASRANAAIRAMRAVDAGIMLGLPLRSDTIGTIALPQQTPRFAETVLRGVTEPFDFVSLHDAYFPFIWDPRARDSDLDVFRATMAAPRVVERDIAHVRSLLARYKPGRQIGIGITEYNALFSLGGPRDSYIASLGGALYIADLLRVFAQTDDVLIANYWSAANNWYFGLVANQLPFSLRPEPRPAYHVLRAYSDALRGRLQPIRVASPTFDSKQVGMVPAQTGIPLVSAFATVDAGTRRLLVINKDPTRPVNLTVAGPAGEMRSIVVQELSSPTLFDPAHSREQVKWVPREAPAAALPFTMRFPPHSMAWIELRAGS